MACQNQYTRLFFSTAHLYWHNQQYSWGHLHWKQIYYRYYHVIWKRLAAAFSLPILRCTWHWWGVNRKPISCMLKINCIKVVSTTIKKSQGNAICERFHQSISFNLHTMLHYHTPHTLQWGNDIMDTWYAAAAYVLKATIHCTLNISSGSFVFHCDMVMNIHSLTDLQVFN